MNKFNPKRIKELREINCLTQKQLGYMLGISDRAVSKWESDLSKPSGQNLVLLAKIFNVPVESFFEKNIVEKIPENISGWSACETPKSKFLFNCSLLV